jgi:hypothetical protein
MPEVIGTVRCVRVVEDSAFACVTEQGTTNNELFILWWDGVTTPANPPARVRIAQSNWVALLRGGAGKQHPGCHHPRHPASPRLGQDGPAERHIVSLLCSANVSANVPSLTPSFLP